MNISDIMFVIAIGIGGLTVFVILLYMGIDLETNNKILGIAICVLGIVVLLFVVALIFHIVEAKTAMQMIEGGA